MKIIAYLIVTLLVLINLSPTKGTFFRHKKNKNKGPLGGPFLSWGTSALDGILRYAPDFYDAVPKVAHKLLTTGGKKHHETYYDYDDDHPLISAGKRTMKRINRLLKPHGGGHVTPIYPVHHGYGFGLNDFDNDLHGFSNFGHYPASFSHGGFDALPVHGVFHGPIDFSSHSFGTFDDLSFDHHF